MSAVQSENNQLEVVRPTALPAQPRGPRLGLPTKDELDALMAYGQVILKSGMAPGHIKTPEAAVVVMRYGHQLGIDEFTALQNMFVVGGKPSAMASLLHALILRDHGGDALQIIASTAKRAELSCKRRDSAHRTTITYTIEDAHQAGLKDGNWNKYPADMLFARAVSRAGRQVFRDSTLGLYTPEELGGQMIEVDGEIVDGRFTNEPDKWGPGTGGGPPLDDTGGHPNRLAKLHFIGGQRGLDHDGLHRIALCKFGRGLSQVSDTMVADLCGEIEKASAGELADWSFDWLAEICTAESNGIAALEDVANRINEAGITQKSRPDIAEAYQAASRRLISQPVEAEYRDVIDKATGEIVGQEAVTEKAGRPTFGPQSVPADKYTS